MLNPTQQELISFGRLKLISRYIRYLEGNLDETEHTQCDNPLFYQLHQILISFSRLITKSRIKENIKKSLIYQHQQFIEYVHKFDS